MPERAVVGIISNLSKDMLVVLSVLSYAVLF
jgi:hypothetical protein